MTAQHEIAPEAKKTFHSHLLMSLNTESEQDPFLDCMPRFCSRKLVVSIIFREDVPDDTA
jgi:hypothetical protein